MLWAADRDMAATMTRGTLAAALALAALPALADERPESVCREARVLERLATMLHQAGRSLVLDPASVGESAAGAGRVVSCAVRGHMTSYETNRQGMQPIDAIFVVHYTLELRQNGIFLRLEDR